MPTDRESHDMKTNGDIKEKDKDSKRKDICRDFLNNICNRVLYLQIFLIYYLFDYREVDADFIIHRQMRMLKRHRMLRTNHINSA